MIGRLLGLIFIGIGALMIPPMLLTFVYDEGTRTLFAFGISALASAGAGLLLFLLCRKAKKDFYAKEGTICVGLCWIGMCLFGALPFVISGEIPRFVDALFETVSGFSTTGASILSDVEALSHSILYWRSFTHWVGGMGVLVLVLALIPVSGRNEGYTLHLLRAESTGPDVGKLVPKIRRTALILYGTYLALTVLDFLFLICGRMQVFDAVCTAFGTAGTGGFGVYNDSMGSFSPYLQNVTTVFMLLFGVNFGCYYLLMMRDVLHVVRDEELRLYVGLIFTAVTLITINTRHLFSGVGEALRHAFFQVASVITTTGFSTVDFDLWPTFSKAILVFLMLIGACAGSTGGGLKCSRLLLVIKNFSLQVRRILNPKKIQAIYINDRPVNDTVVTGTSAYFCGYIIIIVAGFLLISLDSAAADTSTALTASIACFNNIGPGLGGVGPTCNFGGFNALSKCVMMLEMLGGRLEIFPILALFCPGAYKRA